MRGDLRGDSERIKYLDPAQNENELIAEEAKLELVRLSQERTMASKAHMHARTKCMISIEPTGNTLRMAYSGMHKSLELCMMHPGLRKDHPKPFSLKKAYRIYKEDYHNV